MNTWRMRGLVTGLVTAAFFLAVVVGWGAIRPEHGAALALASSMLVLLLGAPTSYAILFFLDSLTNPPPVSSEVLFLLPLPVNWFLIGAAFDLYLAKKQSQGSD